MSKDIILLLDGTWNDADSGELDTNIVRLRYRIENAFWRRQARGGRGSKRKCAIFYERGVGTGWKDRIGGGAFGLGLASNIRNAYRFLSANFEPKDRVFVFGFSRGAYTARSLVGLIGAGGLLRRECCTANLERTVWQYYRTRPNSRNPGIRALLSKYCYGENVMSIECLGVFDTVGALGIPERRFWRFNRDMYEFHEVTLSSLPRVNLQALAIDEHRSAFEASVWQKSWNTDVRSITEQVWFSGSHGDIGGGYTPQSIRTSSEWFADDLSLNWMLSRLKSYYPDFPVELREPFDAVDRVSEINIHESRRGIYLVQPYKLRCISNTMPKDGLRLGYAGFSRYGRPANEMVHISALHRLGADCQIDGKKQHYYPGNLVSVLDLIRKTYDSRSAIGLQEILKVVDWDGRPIDPSDRARASAIRSLLDGNRFSGLLTA